MTVIDTEEGHFVGMRVEILVISAGEIEHCCVSVLHADAPTLHGRDAVDEPFILTSVGSLLVRIESAGFTIRSTRWGARKDEGWDLKGQAIC